MGRMVRRVPMNWEHPKKTNGRYQPMYDETYEDRMKEWESDKAAYEANPDPDCPTFEDCDPLPDPAYYRPKFDDNAVLGWCYYENISEGTPISPVLATADELVDWLVENEGLRREAAQRFVEVGWSLSFVAGPGIDGMQRGVDVMDIIMPKKAED